MKPPIFTLLTIVLALSFNSLSQTKTCETPEEDLLDFNTIVINKCAVEEKKEPVRKIANLSARKKNNRIAHYVRKDKNINLVTEKKHTLAKQVILFSVVDEIPLFSKCHSTKDKQCFNTKLINHFSKNFHPEKASDDGIDGRFYVQFVITTNGLISEISIQGKNNTKALTNEIKRVLYKLPRFSSGKHKGIPVSVKYSLPLNFSS